MAIDPSQSVPDDVATVSSLQSMTEESAKSAMRAPVDASWSNAQFSLGGLLGTLGRIIGGALELGVGLLVEVANGVVSFIQNIADGLRGNLSSSSPFFAVQEAFKDGQLELTERTDLLSPLLDYGAMFNPANNRRHGTGYMYFTEQLGPMRGVAPYVWSSGGGLSLLDKGLWDIRLHMTMDRIVTTTAGIWKVELRVLRLDGTVYSKQSYVSTSANVDSATIVSSVVVPAPGYRVVVQLTDNLPLRGTLGGPEWTRLTAQHISREVDGSWADGSEPSDAPS